MAYRMDIGKAFFSMWVAKPTKPQIPLHYGSLKNAPTNIIHLSGLQRFIRGYSFLKISVRLRGLEMCVWHLANSHLLLLHPLGGQQLWVRQSGRDWSVQKWILWGKYSWMFTVISSISSHEKHLSTRQYVCALPFFFFFWRGENLLERKIWVYPKYFKNNLSFWIMKDGLGWRGF